MRLLLLVLTHPFDSTSENVWVFRRAEERRAFVLVGPLKHSQDSLCDLCVGFMLHLLERIINNNGSITHNANLKDIFSDLF